MFVLTIATVFLFYVCLNNSFLIFFFSFLFVISISYCHSEHFCIGCHSLILFFLTCFVVEESRPYPYCHSERSEESRQHYYSLRFFGSPSTRATLRMTGGFTVIPSVARNLDNITTL